MNRKTVLVLFGGVSSEHMISLLSARSVIGAIPRDRYDVVMAGITSDGRWFRYEGDPACLPDDGWLEAGPCTPAFLSPDASRAGLTLLHPTGAIQRIPVDVVFPVLHGKNGEDGAIQGLLTLAGLPFVGCDVAASAVTMDKALTNLLTDAVGIPQAKWRGITRHAYEQNGAAFLKEAAEYLDFPIFVKPARTGSSVGVSKARNGEELREAMTVAFAHDDKVVLEEGILGAEVECAVLGNEEPIASDVGEIVPCHEFYDFDAKYLDDATELHIPARLPQEKREEIRALACRAFRAFGCSGLARIDFFVRASDGAVLLNEPNTIPGFTSISMYPKLFEAAGLPYPELLDRLMTLALEKWGR